MRRVTVVTGAWVVTFTAGFPMTMKYELVDGGTDPSNASTTLGLFY